MFELIVTVWLLSLADLFFTIWAHLFTPFAEANPIARSMLIGNQFATLICYKLSATLVGTLIFWRLRKHAHAELSLWAIALVYVMLTLRWHQYTLGASIPTATAADDDVVAVSASAMSR